MTEIRFDHIALALPHIADAVPFLVGTLGGTPAFGADSGVYRFGQWRFANRARLEVLEPIGADGFLHRFLSARGPGIHHVTFKVPSLREACDRAKEHGYDIVGYNAANPYWKEAFLHPRRALGIVVQLAESARGGTAPPWTPPATPPDAPPPVAVVGLRMSARSRERARTQWLTILNGEEAGGSDGSLVYTWPRSPLRIAVEIDSGREEGPIAIEIAGERKVSVPSEPHPVLGAWFTQG
jgi:catechol 2,3-dioxygenase-like lactoylglutathione lyase family enzyme